jgi:hypothetical protein
VIVSGLDETTAHSLLGDAAGSWDSTSRKEIDWH